MTERQLIDKIQQLKKIEPNSDWVLLAKNRIIKEETGFPFQFIFGHKLATSALVALFALVGVFGFTLTSVPGDSLFILKKVAENGSGLFVAKIDQPRHNLELSRKRLDDLAKIAEENNIRHLASAINEYEESISKTAESLISIEDSGIMEQLTDDIREIEEGEAMIKSLGIEVGQNDELNNALAVIIEREIEVLRNKERTEEEEEILNNITFEYEQGNYSRALEILLLK